MHLPSGVQLTYCSNIHPGESWGEMRRQLALHLPAIRARLSPNETMGLGLRVSARAARELSGPSAFAELLELLDQTGTYVFTLNGFPYGTFHGAPVKEQVYQPDWTTPERRRYTSTLGQLLARLQPHQLKSSSPFSISTVPGGFRSGQTEASKREIAKNLAVQAAEFYRLREETGVAVALAVEPEPACLLETTSECVDFLNTHVFDALRQSDFRREVLAQANLGHVSASMLEQGLRAHLGLCLDACHAAVQFEDPQETVTLLRTSGVSVFKLQATAALRLVQPTAGALARLKAFDNGVYLHQGSRRHSGGVEHFLDLPDALAEDVSGVSEEEWRVHFHVPVFQAEFGEFTSTQSDLKVYLEQQRLQPLTSHIEVETYTFDVLPEEFRATDVVEAICREMEWTRDQLLGGSGDEC